MVVVPIFGEEVGGEQNTAPESAGAATTNINNICACYFPTDDKEPLVFRDFANESELDSFNGGRDENLSMAAG